MGEAKRRGTFEERQAEGIEKERLKEIQREERRMEYWRSLSKKEKQAALLAASLMVMTEASKL